MLKEIASVSQVYLVTGYTDLRLGIDGLAAIVQWKLELDPYSRALFLFCGRRKDRIKSLLWEGDGFYLLYKRLDNGCFRWPRNESEAKLLTQQEVRWLFEGLELEQPKAIKPGRKAKTDSRMWFYCAQPKKTNAGTEAGCAPEIVSQSPKSNILFEYQPTRNGDHAARFLGEYSGYFVCDGFDGYNKLKKAVRCGCWAHVRRKFVDALPSDKELLATSAAAKGVEYCNKLFLLERHYSGRNEKDEQIAEPMTAEERHNARQAQSKPVLEDFFVWLDTIEVFGKTALAKAVQYAKNEKNYLCRFLESGDIPSDNNRAENAIRPFCVGRKNWLFSASVKGADASAMMYSVAATVCANGRNVEEYLAKLFRCDAGTVVLPW